MGNPFVHVEIRCRDLPRSRGFYEGVFGWKFSEGPPGQRFVLFDAGSGVPGDIQEVSEGRPVGVTAFIRVKDIDGMLERIKDTGGKVVMKRTEIPGGYGWWAVFTDPDGNLLAISEAPK